jgi:hypothetical protein
MKSRYFFWFVALFTLVLIITGCGGSGSSPNPPAPISVSFSPQPPLSLNASAGTNLTAVVNNDSAGAGVKWTVSCSSSQCGSFSATSTASGATTRYSAPASAAMVTVTATSVTDSTKSASAMITIATPSAPISVTLNSPPSSLAATTTAALTATVSNDSSNAGVTWSVTCGSAQCGSFNPTSTLSGAASTYTAPAAPPTPATVTVTATSVSDTSKSASATITITAAPPAPPVLADGNYVFHVAGYDGTGPYFVAGAFTVQNGAISGGEQDVTDNTTMVQNQISPSQSSLSVVNGNIQIALNTNNTALGVNGIETFRGTVVSNARALIEEFDTFATATGSIDAQTSTAAPAGGYAFNLGGLDGASVQNWLVIGGVLNISGSSISVANSVLDYNDGGDVVQKQSFASGTVGAPDAFGRVVFTLTPTASSALPVFAVVGYTVSTGQIQLVETSDTLNGDLGGTALGQGSNTGTFSQASVAGNSYAFGANGLDDTTAGGNLVQLGGALGLNANGTVSGDIVLNDLNFHFGSTVTSGSYTVDPTGRVTVTATVTSGSLSNNPTFTFQLYLDGNGNALELGVDDLQATSGLSYVQQAPSGDFEGNYAVNVFGFSGINMEPAWSAAGPVTISSDSISGYTDYSLQNASNSASGVTPGISLTGSEDSSTGLLTLLGLYAGDLPGSPQTDSSYGYYPIDSGRVIAIEVDGQQMGLMMLEGMPAN